MTEKEKMASFGCEYGRTNRIFISEIKRDLNRIGKVMTRIWWGIIVVGLVVLTNSQLAEKILSKMLGLGK